MDIKSQASFGKFHLGQPKKRLRINNRNLSRPNIELLSAEEAADRNRQQYLNFVANWRKGYEHLATEIRALKIASKNMESSEAARQSAMRVLQIVRAQARAMMICREALQLQYMAEQMTVTFDIETDGLSIGQQFGQIEPSSHSFLETAKDILTQEPSFVEAAKRQNAN